MWKNVKGVATNAWKLGLKNMAQITTVIGLISATLGLWWQIDKKLEESMMEQTQVIIAEMNVRTSWIAEFEKEDLFERIQVLELEIKALEDAGEPVPGLDQRIRGQDGEVVLLLRLHAAEGPQQHADFVLRLIGHILDRNGHELKNNLLDTQNVLGVLVYSKTFWESNFLYSPHKPCNDKNHREFGLLKQVEARRLVGRVHV